MSAIIESIEASVKENYVGRAVPTSVAPKPYPQLKQLVLSVVSRMVIASVIIMALLSPCSASTRGQAQASEPPSFDSTRLPFENVATRPGLDKFDKKNGNSTAHESKVHVAPKLKFTRLSTNDGLSHSDVRSLVQDHQGFMWFGTLQGGLNRYDGREFKVYRHDPDNPRSLAADGIFSMFVDHKGTLWVGTRGGGLDRYDRDTDSFVHYGHDPKVPGSLPQESADAVYEDSAGVLWVGTQGGLARFDANRGTFHSYFHDPKDPGSLSENPILSICEDRETGLLWIGSNAGGISVLDRTTERFTHYTSHPDDPGSLSDNTARHIFQDRSGNMWVATDGGLNRFDRTTGKFIHYRHDPNNPSSLADDMLNAVYEDSSGRFWVATMKGLDLMDRNAGTFIHYRTDPDDPDSLSHDFAWRFCEDDTGALWVSTIGGGVNRLPREPEKFVTYRHSLSNPHSLTDNSVQGLAVDETGTLWIGTTLGGIHSFDGETITRHPEDPGNPDHRKISYVHGMAAGPHGVLWIGTFGTGLWRYDGQRYINYRHDPKDPASVFSDNPASVFADENGGLWIGLHWNSGMDYFDGKVFTHYPASPEANRPGTIPAMCPFLCFKDASGRLWMGSDDHGIICFDPKTKTAVNYLVNPNNPGDAVNMRLYSIYPASDGIYWVGSATGLYRFDPAQGKFTQHYTSKDGLPSDSVVAVNGDAQGYLWLSTLAGISRFDPRTGRFRNYDKADGMAGNLFNRWVTAKGPDGQLFFGSEQGLVAFHPERIKDNPHVPPVVLTGFSLFDRPQLVGARDSLLEQAIETVGQVTLRHDQSVFSFRFAALDYSAPQKNRYAYKLEGFDKDWRYTDAANRQATYTNLDPGNYVFRVKGSNNDGVWNETGTSVRVVILPPWWMTTWFRGLVLTGLLGTMVGGYRVRVRSIQQRSRMLERQVAERTGELVESNQKLQIANRAKSIFLASMSHELRTPLNAILGYTQIIRGQQNLTSRQRRQLDVMHASGEHLLTLISDILDLSRIEAQRLELTKAPFSLPRLFDQVLEITRVRADQKHIELQYERVSALPESVHGDERRVRQILLNLLANAVKFTERGRVILRIRYDSANGVLRCEVADTGIGIPQDKLESIFEPFAQLTPDTQGREGVGLGLTITSRLAMLMGGSVSVESELGRGSTFRFSAPLPSTTAAEPVAEPMQLNIRGFRGDRRHVLVVDDIPANAQLLVDILEPLGFDMATANNGRDALRKALEHRPDLVLLDMVMPEMDGVEAAQKMREHPELKAMRIVGVSATVTGSERKRAFMKFCDGFMGKPVQVEELLHTVGQLLELEWEIAPDEMHAPSAEDMAPTRPAVPPEEVLHALRRAAERGNFVELERLLDRQAKEADYSAFCQQIQRLAEKYDDDGVIAYLDQLGISV